MPHSPLPTHTPILQTYLNPNITVPFSSRPTGHLVILNHSKYLHLLLVTFYSFSIWLIPAHSQSSVQCSFANNPPPMTYAERLAFPLALLSIKLSWTPPPPQLKDINYCLACNVHLSSYDDVSCWWMKKWVFKWEKENKLWQAKQTLISL